RGKPAPDLFLYAATQMDVPPEQCIVVEDAHSGVQAALAANMIAVGIGPVERVGDAHFRYDTTADIDLDQILAALN
ncbi:MAG: HAD-IA family hydrolase, partial [Anaerolineae bacterium]|nr:HAD-IA family hydrolase [Anaerolineae bacterium]